MHSLLPALPCDHQSLLLSSLLVMPLTSSSRVVIMLCLRLPIASPFVNGDRCAHGSVSCRRHHCPCRLTFLLLFFFPKRSNDRIAGNWSCIFDPLSCHRGRHSLLAARHRSNRIKGRCNFCWIIYDKDVSSGMVTWGQRQCLVVVEVMMLPRCLLAV